jgi:predicted nucleic acid-binding protein
MASYVLDTSAILTILNQEDGVDTVLDLLKRAGDNRDLIFIPFIALMELEYLLLRKIIPEETQALLELIKAWPVTIPESTEEWRHLAAAMKAQTSLSVADAWIASLAWLNQAELVHKDPEYEKAPDLQMIKLPYK